VDNDTDKVHGEMLDLQHAGAFPLASGAQTEDALEGWKKSAQASPSSCMVAGTPSPASLSPGGQQATLEDAAGPLGAEAEVVR
jgi:hypothetical protein